MARKGKMTAAQKQRRRERREARRKARLKKRTPEERERRASAHMDRVFFGGQQLRKLGDELNKVTKARRRHRKKLLKRRRKAAA